jgi:SPP1 family predicted phage head-tail adaptor
MLRSGANTLDIGSLRHQVTIQKRVDHPDVYGQLIPTWVDVISPWGGFSSLNATERFQANQLSTQVTDVFTMRYPASVTITSGMRLIFAGKTFDIQTPIDPDFRHVVLKLFLLETQNAG